MTNIDVRRIGDRVEITIDEENGQISKLNFPLDTAIKIGAQMVGCSDEELPGSLFSQAPMMTVYNPKYEIARTDAGQLVLGILPNKMRPIFIQLDKMNANLLIRDMAGDDPGPKPAQDLG